ncbi:hypothetical protein CcCBS67573_g00743 [Chytriomyces confervae]|uniref:Zinc finger PHD-type domain-containing protein n=1 Tax=Chytriomyces confervae TaxID=246404 RepID=A0A507FNT6_9FUNG|nr:hypothetical protein CcCBS67573_g00743 [Chytriomyces confervae]
MDDYIAACVDEIALEGPSGCTLDRLWSLVASKWQTDGPIDVEQLALGSNTTPFTDMDEPLRNYVWPFLLSDSQLSVRGDVEQVSKDDLMNMSQGDIVGRYGNRLQIAASAAARQFSLGITNVRISDVNANTLCIIAKARKEGVTQVELSKLAKMDARNLFHQIKVLLNHNLIEKIPVTIKGTHTNLCILRRFIKENEHYVSFQLSQQVAAIAASDQAIDDEVIQEQVQMIMEERRTRTSSSSRTVAGGEPHIQCELIKHQITVLLAGAKGNVMLTSDITDVLASMGPVIPRLDRKMINRAMITLSDKGHVEIFLTPVARGGNSQEMGNERCLRLLKIYSRAAPAKSADGRSGYYLSDEYRKKIASEPEKNLVLGNGAVRIDLPIDFQVYNIICLSGMTGTTSTVIRRSLSNLNPRVLERILKKLSKPLSATADPPVQSELEFQGRERRFRYFSTENYRIIKGTAVKNETRLTSLVQSALAAYEAFNGRAAVNVVRPSARFATKNPGELVRKRKYSRNAEEDEEEEEEGLGESDDDSEIVGSSVNIDTPRTLRTRKKDLNFAIFAPPEEEPETQDSDLEHVACSVCKEGKDDDLILLCDCCDEGTHTYCATPQLDKIPEGDWFCSDECILKGKPAPQIQKKKARVELGSDGEESDFDMGGIAEEASSEDEFDEDARDDSVQPLLQRSSSSSSTPLPIFSKSLAPVDVIKGENDPLQQLAVTADGEPNQTELAAATLQKDRQDTAVPDQQTRTIARVSNPSGLEPSSIQNAQLTGNDDVIFAEAVASAAKPALRADNTKTPGAKKSAPGSLIVVDSVALTPNGSEVKSSRSTMHKGLSSNAVKREKILLQLLDSQKIIEINNSTGKAIADIIEAEGESSASRYSIDRKTLARTAASMAQRGLAKFLTMQVPKLNGRAIQRQILLHISLSETGPEVEQFKVQTGESTLSLRQTYMPPSQPIQTVETLERPLDLHRRFLGGVENITPSVNNRRLLFSGNDEADLDAIASADPYRFWLGAAQKYGYTLAKVIRLRSFHEWLFTQFYANFADIQSDEQPREKGTFSAVDVYNYMTLDIFLKNVGVTAHHPELDAYLGEGGDPECCLKDLPEKLRFAILSKTYKLKLAVIGFLDYLKMLDIVSPIGEENSDIAGGYSAFNMYRLNQTVSIHDHRRTGSPLVKNMKIESRENVRQYWMQMEYLYRKLLQVTEGAGRPAEQLQEATDDATNEEANERSNESKEWQGLPEEKPKKRKRKSPRARHAVPPGSSAAIAKMLMLLQPKNWQSSYLFTPEEITVMESHIDRKRMVFPVDDNIKIKALGEQFGVAPIHIKHYFYRVQSNYERRLLTLQERRVARMKALNKSGESLVVLAKNQKKVRELLSRSVTGPSVGQNNSAISEQEGDLVQSSDMSFPFPKQRTRRVWSTEDEILVMHAYAITRYLAVSRDTRFSWKPVASATNTPRELCRRKIAVQLGSKLNEERINFLIAEWPLMYQDAVKDGFLPEIPVAELQTINIDEHAKFYREKSNLLLRTASFASEPAPALNQTVLHLVATPAMMEDVYNVYAFQGAHHKTSQLHLQLQEAETIRAKMSALYSKSLAACVDDNDCLDHCLSFGRISCPDLNVHKVISCAKSSMLTPAVRYDSEIAFNLLYQFPNEAIARGLESLVTEGALVKSKSAVRDRHVPGRSATLSDKFLSTISGILPARLIPQSRSAFDAIQSHAVHVWAPIPQLNNGIMCVLLDKATCGAIKLSPDFSLSADDPEIVMKPISTLNRDDMEVSTPDFKSVDQWHKDVHEETLKVVDRLQEHSEQEKLLMQDNTISDAQITEALRLMRSTHLDDCELTLVSQVGQRFPVYVSASFAKSWMVQANPVQTANMSSDLVPKSFPLRLWYDIHGNLIESALRACMECVMSHIVEVPGLYESTLRRLVHPVMSNIELNDGQC